MDGAPYLYTLTLSCPDEEWPQLGPLYAQAQESFRLVDTTQVTFLLPCETGNCESRNGQACDAVASQVVLH